MSVVVVFNNDELENIINQTAGIYGECYDAQENIKNALNYVNNVGINWVAAEGATVADMLDGCNTEVNGVAGIFAEARQQLSQAKENFQNEANVVADLLDGFALTVNTEGKNVQEFVQNLGASFWAVGQYMTGSDRPLDESARQAALNDMAKIRNNTIVAEGDILRSYRADITRRYNAGEVTATGAVMGAFTSGVTDGVLGCVDFFTNLFGVDVQTDTVRTITNRVSDGAAFIGDSLEYVGGKVASELGKLSLWQ